jgi:hypothetical protein
MIAHGSASGTAAASRRPDPHPRRGVRGYGRRTRARSCRELAAPAHAHMSCARPPRPAHARLPPLPSISAAAPAFFGGGLLDGQKSRVSRASRAVRRGQGDRAANLVRRLDRMAPRPSGEGIRGAFWLVLPRYPAVSSVLFPLESRVDGWVIRASRRRDAGRLVGTYSRMVAGVASDAWTMPRAATDGGRGRERHHVARATTTSMAWQHMPDE